MICRKVSPMPDVVRSFSCTSVIFSSLISLVSIAAKVIAVATCLISSLQDLVTELVRLLLPISSGSVDPAKRAPQSGTNLMTSYYFSIYMDVEVIGEFFREVSEWGRESAPCRSYWLLLSGGLDGAMAAGSAWLSHHHHSSHRAAKKPPACTSMHPLRAR